MQWIVILLLEHLIGQSRSLRLQLGVSITSLQWGLLLLPSAQGHPIQTVHAPRGVSWCGELWRLRLADDLEVEGVPRCLDDPLSVGEAESFHGIIVDLNSDWHKKKTQKNSFSFMFIKYYYIRP